MADEQKAAPGTLNWYPTNERCPRCTQPIKVRATLNFTRILEQICTSCGWRQDIETMRKGAKAAYVAPDAEAESDEPESS